MSCSENDSIRPWKNMYILRIKMISKQKFCAGCLLKEKIQKQNAKNFLKMDNVSVMKMMLL